MPPPVFLFIACLAYLFPELGQFLLGLWGALVFMRLAK